MLYLCLFLISKYSFSSVFSIESLTYGIDSPVNIASFTTTFPLSSKMSHGTDLWDETIIYSVLNSFSGSTSENGIYLLRNFSSSS